MGGAGRYRDQAISPPVIVIVTSRIAASAQNRLSLPAVIEDLLVPVLRSEGSQAIGDRGRLGGGRCLFTPEDGAKLLFGLVAGDGDYLVSSLEDGAGGGDYRLPRPANDQR